MRRPYVRDPPRALPVRRRLIPIYALGAALASTHMACAAAPAPESPGRTIALPAGYQPEGIVAGPPGIGYVGTLTGGGVIEVSFRTGATRFVVPPRAPGERVVAGLAYDVERLQIVACGAWLSNAFVFDLRTGAVLDEVRFPSGLINSVALRDGIAYFTDSARPVLHEVRRGADGTFEGAPREVPLGGAFRSAEGLMDLASNGIVAPAGTSDVLIVHSARGELYAVATDSGLARLVDIGGVDIVGGDGLVLDERGLVVVQNGAEGRVSIFALAPGASSARRIATVTDPELRSPTTAAWDGDTLWVVSSRLLEIFHGMASPEDRFELVRVDLTVAPAALGAGP